jgi:predicted membrane channel-forming protein YqfA (hemolysin III family)
LIGPDGTSLGKIMYIFFGSIILPILFMAVMTLWEHVASGLPLRQSFIRATWDVCILSLGIIGGIIAQDEVILSYQGRRLLAYVLLAIALSLGSAGMIMKYRKRAEGDNTCFGICIAFGLLALLGPSFIIVRALVK